MEMVQSIQCQGLLEASKNIALYMPTDPYSPESCNQRCFDNITKIDWSEGHCTCQGTSTDCPDFDELCGSFLNQPPKFFKMLGLSSWMHVTVAISVGLATFAILFSFVLWLVRKRSSTSIIQRTKREGVRFKSSNHCIFKKKIFF